ncbi:MAG: DUF2914 domain-containing protein [Elusimicrobia bacterium]|nr:DUF2914 domain-containing protein [Candidatus Obscuribacterium magneticum]
MNVASLTAIASAKFPRLAAAASKASRYRNLLFFVGGFLFDAVTLVRIDSTLDLIIQSAYLLGITSLVLLQTRHDTGLFQPTGWMEKAWHYESEAIHFFYGGLLSAYTIFYFKSTTFSKSFIFLLLIIALMVANEMPQVRRLGSSMRLGLYVFCLISYLNYLYPVVIGRMGDWIFALAWVTSLILAGAVVYWLARWKGNTKRMRFQLGWPPAAVLILVAVFYFYRWIPPVPLSLQYGGIYHNVQAEDGRYRLTYQRPPWVRFWRKDDRLFLSRRGDRLFCFVRIFAPTRFSHQVYLRWVWRSPTSGRWMMTDRVPLLIKGGRGRGFRGFAVKDQFQVGRWKIDVETEDGRVLGFVPFTVRTDASSRAPNFRDRWM